MMGCHAFRSSRSRTRSGSGVDEERTVDETEQIRWGAFAQHDLVAAGTSAAFGQVEDGAGRRPVQSERQRHLCADRLWRIRARNPSPQPGSIRDVQRVAQGLIESSSGGLVEVADRFVVEVVERDGDDVVAADDTRLGKSVLAAELDFRSDTSNGAGDRCAGDCGEHFDRRVAGQQADGPTTSGRSEIGPVDVVASYHAGAVSAASRLADRTSAGSAGCRRYAARSSRSAAASRSASSTAWAPRRNSSERLVPRSVASASSCSTRSSSSCTSTSRRAMTIWYPIWQAIGSGLVAGEVVTVVGVERQRGEPGGGRSSRSLGPGPIWASSGRVGR
jgi:hypothetical protein